MQISKTASLTNYLLPVYRKKIAHPAFIILPGGGYTFVSLRESAPIAHALNALGYQAFVLDYTTWEKDRNLTFQMLQEEVRKTIEYIVENADMLRVDPDQIYLMGFSAGGHLAAISGSLFYKYIKKVVLAYPYLSPKYNQDDSLEILGEGKEALHNLFNIDASDYISKNTPPTFIWGTYEDNVVALQAMLDYIRRCDATNIPVEFHLYEKGSHGLSLATEATMVEDEQVNPHVASWMLLLNAWLKL